MDQLFLLGEASVADVVARLPDEPSYDAIRVTLSILEKKGFVMHRQEGPRYIYRPAIPTEQARRSALKHLLGTFFVGAPAKAILSILDLSSHRLSPEDLEEIAAWIEKAREESDA